MMRVLFVVAALSAVLSLPAHAQDDDPMEFQRCIWRCLSDSNGADDPAYHACVANMCGEEEPVQQSKAPSWAGAPHRGEERRSVLGCSDATNDDSWTCLIVRCDDDGELRVYYDYSDGGIDGDFALDVDGARYPVSQDAATGTPFTGLRTDESPALVAAMKRGRAVRIVDATPPLNPGFDTIQLRGSSRAIGRLESACRRR